jgi:hypothetical protein
MVPLPWRHMKTVSRDSLVSSCIALPHITGSAFETFCIMSRMAKQSSRSCLSGILFRKAVTLFLVGAVLFSAMREILRCVLRVRLSYLYSLSSALPASLREISGQPPLFHFCGPYGYLPSNLMRMNAIGTAAF